MIVIEIKTFWNCVQSSKWGSTSRVSGIKNIKYEMIWHETKVKECLKEYFRVLCGNDSHMSKSEMKNGVTNVSVQEIRMKRE